MTDPHKISHVFLIHGMGRTTASLWPVARRLRAEGFSTHSFGYAVSQERLESISSRWIQALEDGLRQDENEGDYVSNYAVIGHSLGNVITRFAWPKIKKKPSKLIMLAPPNQSPLMARRLKDNPLYRLMTQDAGQKLASDAFYRNLPRPDVPILVISGHGGRHAKGSVFRGKKNDMLVAEHETFLEGAQSLRLDTVHTFVMWKKEVLDAIIEFLEVPVDLRGGDGGRP